jgi:hypothetical protein
MTSRREKPPIFAFLKRLVKSQQGSGLQDDCEPRDDKVSPTQTAARPRVQRRSGL